MTPGTLPWQRLSLLFLLLGSLFAPARSTICAGLTYYTANTTSQTFTTPDYPSNYGINVFCSWLIKASDSSHMVRITVDTSSLENPDGSGSCSYDYGRAYDGNDMNTLLGDWCGSTTLTLTSTGSEMLVVFRSDYSTVSTGFSLSYLSGTFPTVSSPADYTIIIACSVSAFVLIVGIIIFCCIRSKLKRNKQHKAEDKEKLPQAEDVEANHVKYQESAKARFSQRIVPSSKGKRSQEIVIEPENTAASRVAVLNATAAAASKKKEEKEKEKEEKKKEAERKKAEEKAAKEEQKAKAAEEKKRIAEEKKQAAEKAAEEKRKAAEEKKLAAEKAAEEKRLAAEKAAEEKKVAAEKAAEEKRKAEEEKKLAAEKAAEEKKAAEQNQAAAKEATEEKNKEEESPATEQTQDAEVKKNDTEKPSKKNDTEKPSKKKTPGKEKVSAAAVVAVTTDNIEEEKARPTTKQTTKKKVEFEEKTQEFEAPKSEESPQAGIAAAAAAAAAASNATIVQVQSATPDEDSSDKALTGEPEPQETKEKEKSKTKDKKTKGKTKTEKTKKVDTEPAKPVTREKSNVSKPETKREKSTVAPMTKEKSTVAPLTKEKSTVAPLTKEKSSVAPTTKEKSTVAPMTKEKSTVAPMTKEKSTVAPLTKEKSTVAPLNKEKSTVDKPAVKNNVKSSDTAPKKTSKSEKSADSKPKTPQSSDKPKTDTTPAKDSAKEGKSTTKEASKSTAVVTVKPASTVKENTKLSLKVEPKADNASKKDNVDATKQKTKGKEKTTKTSEQPEPDHQTETSHTAEESKPIDQKNLGGISFGNKPGETTRPGSKVVLLPSVVMVESAESKKRKKMEDQWDKHSLARQHQASVQGGHVTPRVSTATSSVQKKYQPMTNRQISEEDTKVSGDGPEKKRAQTSGSVASLEKDEGINMDYEGGDSGKSTPATPRTAMTSPRINTPRDNNVVTPSVVHPSIVTSSISGTPDPNQQPVPIDTPLGERHESPGSPPARFGSPMEGSVEDIEKRLKVVMQWPRPWTYKSLQFSEKDISDELSMQRSKTTFNFCEHAQIHGAPTTAPRLVKQAFGAEDGENSKFKNAVIATLAAKSQAASTQKITPKGRNLLTR